MATGQWTVCLNGNTVVLTGFSHILLSKEGMAFDLVDHRLDSLALVGSNELFDVMHSEVAHAQRTNLTLFDKLAERAPGS